jgi:hypothetical protein
MSISVPWQTAHCHVVKNGEHGVRTHVYEAPQSSVPPVPRTSESTVGKL